MKVMDLLSQVSLSYDTLEVLNQFQLSVPEGRITSIVGPSGCGKTSLLNLLAGFVKPSEGIVSVQDHGIGYVFQEDRLLPWETVYNNIALVRDVLDHEAIMNLLKALDLEDFKDKYPSALSGGMRQRCALGRGFYYNGSLLLMDEPFQSLDYDLRLNLVSYLGRLWQKEQNTILFVTHDIDEALLLGHQVVVLSKRPARILKTYELTSPLEERKISGQRHVEVRSQIIELLAN